MLLNLRKCIHIDYGVKLNDHYCEMLKVKRTLIVTGWLNIYRQTSNIRRTLAGNLVVDNSDVVGASPVGAAPTTSELST